MDESINWQTISISIGGYEVWPPSWLVVVSVVVLTLVAVVMGMLLVIRGRNRRQDE